MTQHWIDIKNADVIMILGSNAAENHPMSFKWVQAAIDNGATLINVDPRFSRSSSRAHVHGFMRSGTDIAFIGGMIKYALDNNRYNEKYVRECTNALFKLNSGFETCMAEPRGVFSGFTAGTYDANLAATLDSTYSKATWTYDAAVPTVADDLDDPDCVFTKLKEQFSLYTPEFVCSITGTDLDTYLDICDRYTATYPDDKSANIMYAMGTTQHTVGTQNIRAYAILQLLLGNMGVAGGGVNALRGQDNVQGSTDMCILSHILPGYLKVPTPAETTLAAYNDKYYDPADAINPVTPYTVRGVTMDPSSAYWWQNGTKYIASLLKAWWPTRDLETAYSYLSRKTGDYSILSMFDAMAKGTIKGFICDGENPAVSDPDSLHVREALGNLEWMVCIDPYETETAAFWKRPGADSSTINTTVFLLPAAVAIEKAGSRSNSGRWAQWSWTNVAPPGDAKDDLEIITQLGLAMQAVYAGGGVSPDPIRNLNWPYFNYNPADDVDTKAEKCAMEVNGYHLNPDGSINTSINPSGLVTSFAALTATGTTCSGNWLYCNQFVDPVNFDGFENANPGIWAATPGNRCARRHVPDVPNGGLGADPQYPFIGLHSYWSWCWPLNRRIVYNRASTYQSDLSGSTLAGDPLAPQKYVIRYDGGWKGDVPDHGGAPGAVYPFIMHKEGHGHIFGPGVAEGPFPWHYEPAESPIPYPEALGAYRMNPMVHNFGAYYAAHGDPTFDIVATTYRLTEHWHTGSMTRNQPRLNELQPEPFVEMSEELAASKGIANGQLVTIGSARGSITMRACVTKRLKPFTIEGRVVHQVGIIWHWGYMGLSTADSGNVVTPFIGDANTRIQESKAFRVSIDPA